LRRIGEFEQAALDQLGQHTDEVSCIFGREFDELAKRRISIHTRQHAHRWAGAFIEATQEFALTKTRSLVYGAVVKQDGG
jgi:hypothetical protein